MSSERDFVELVDGTVVRVLGRVFDDLYEGLTVGTDRVVVFCLDDVSRSDRRSLNEDIAVDDAGLSPYSVDDQIDAYIKRAERRSIERPTGIAESTAPRRRRVLEDDVPVTTSDEVSDVPPVNDVRVPEVNIDVFASKVADLIRGYTYMLDIETVIYNRAVRYVSEHFPLDVVERFVTMLREVHGVEVAEDDVDLDGPIAQGAREGGA